MTKKNKTQKRVQLSDLKLRVMAEYDSSGIWIIGTFGPFRHSMVGYDWLGLPPDLAQRFQHWIKRYDGCLDYPEFAHIGFNASEFNQIGRSLAQELKAHIGPEGYVEFQPELDEGGPGEAEIIA